MPSDNSGRQFVRYLFLKVAREWRCLAPAERESSKGQIVSLMEDFAERMELRVYSTVGTRADTDLLVWQASERLEDLQAFQTQLYATRLGPYLEIPYAYLAMTRRSQYTGKHLHPGQEGTRVRLRPMGSRYLFVYPFVKTRAWYRLPLEERQALMDEHIAVGHRFPSVKINTAYSFGLDDQEFVVAFETDSPGDFLDLVMALREIRASEFTLRDTPIFTCTAASPAEALEALGG